MRIPFPGLYHGIMMGVAALIACGCTAAPPARVEAPAAQRVSPSLVVGIDGFSGPESVRYDPGQDVYFVSNFNGAGGTLDNNGFISQVSAEGRIDQLRFIAGGVNGVTLHAPRGMTIAGDTLWVADVDAVRAFDRRTGRPLATVSFAARDIGFLNDVASEPDRGLYITDTGRNRIYRIAGITTRIAFADTVLGAPNGITWNAARREMIVVPYGGGREIFAWTPGTAALRTIGTSATGGRYDGVEVRGDGSIIVASQADSSIQIFRDGRGTPLFKVAGRPADIAWDSRRNRVVIPYIARTRVEVWQLPD